MPCPKPALVVCASIVLAVAGGRTLDSAAASRRGEPAGAERVVIESVVNGLLASVQADGSIAPGSVASGLAAQFDRYELGKGLIALRSAATGKYVSARDEAPLMADRDAVGDAETFRPVGGAGGLVRLRAVASRAFVCADEGGNGAWTASKGCPNPWQLLSIERVETEPPAGWTITTPSPGTTLRTTSVTFTWEAIGDEFWLTAGTSPGAADVYASESLGPATSHIVSGLPLNGATLFVEVRRRAGATYDAARVHYTAPIRKGLAVITDFADRQLEDWPGPGIRTVEDLAGQLRQMEAHWSWLSRGSEVFRWDIIRIELPRPAAADAYAGWDAFRDAAILLARQQVQTVDYDVDSDGIIDAVWLVVSSGHEPVPFAIGGMSRNAGANLFVDGQASESVQRGATGNFTHELGHCLGLPDLYGPYSTVGDLTVMGYSWWVPPSDFTAYERMKLGWLEPQVITETTSGVWLPSAREQFAAVLIPTVRASEYFLIEYRDPPVSGFGSRPGGYRGLAVYHVLETSSMWQDPPLMKLEPADGSALPGTGADPGNFFYPENPAMMLPMTFRSYYHDGDEVFRIHNVHWRDDGLAFDIEVAPQPQIPTPVNLLVNPSFEIGVPDRPAGWRADSWIPQGTTFAWPALTAVDGQYSAYLEASSENDMRWIQTVASLVSGQQYLLCGTIKGEGIEGSQGNVGGNVSILGGFVRSDAVSGTFDWTPLCVQFTAEAPSVEVACRLGFYGSTVRGKLWCDDFRLERVGLRRVFTP